jgi:hypothetical protein
MLYLNHDYWFVSFEYMMLPWKLLPSTRRRGKSEEETLNLQGLPALQDLEVCWCIQFRITEG